MGDPILHIELRRWADIVLVTPCSANCDNLAVSICIVLQRELSLIPVDISSSSVSSHYTNIYFSSYEYTNVRAPAYQRASSRCA